MNSDFLEFDIEDMYFDKPLHPEAEALINAASEQYGDDNAELLLLKAMIVAPDHLSVFVALYRYYYYQHRLLDAARVVEMAIRVSARQLSLNEEWREVDSYSLAAGAYRSVGLVRFYLLALKAYGFVKVRMGDVEEGMKAMRAVVAHDPSDRLKTKALLEIIQTYTYSKENENVLSFAFG